MKSQYSTYIRQQSLSKNGQYLCFGKPMHEKAKHQLFSNLSKDPSECIEPNSIHALNRYYPSYRKALLELLAKF